MHRLTATIAARPSFKLELADRTVGCIVAPVKSSAQHAYPPDSKAGDILAAAERLFCRHGYEGVSVNQVAREAGVSKANVFHHFGSKEDLYLEVVRNARSALTREILAITQTPVGVERLLTQVAEAELRHLFENADHVRLFMRECLATRPERSKALAEKVFGSTFAELVTALQGALQRGEMRSDINVSFPIMVLFAACVFYFQNVEVLRHLPGADPALTDPETFVRELVNLLVHGLLPSA